jgi:hypothetical protein
MEMKKVVNRKNKTKQTKFDLDFEASMIRWYKWLTLIQRIRKDVFVLMMKMQSSHALLNYLTNLTETDITAISNTKSIAGNFTTNVTIHRRNNIQQQPMCQKR